MRQLGLVHEVCAPADLEQTGARIVECLLMNAPLATRATKLRALRLAGAFVDDEVFGDLMRAHAATRQMAKASEGLASFGAKRAPARYGPPGGRPAGDHRSP